MLGRLNLLRQNLKRIDSFQGKSRFLSSFQFSSVAEKTMTCREALGSALDEEMTRDEKVFIMGEEVGQFQGPYKVTKGLLQKFGPKRVIDTPIAEMGFTGIGCGAAYHGLRPVIDFMTWNFALQSIDHVINSASKIHYMSAGELKCPIVFRGPNGAAAAVAAQHSQDFAAWFANCPGLKVIAPWNAEDCRGLLKAAIRDDTPVVVLENEILYGHSYPVNDQILDKDFVLPIGKAKIEKAGTDVSVFTYSIGVDKCLEVAQKLEGEGISCEVINLRSLRPLDRTTIINSAKKTHRVVTVEEGWPVCGIGAEICAIMMETDAFDFLDAPVERVTGLDIPMPYAANLERMCLPQIENIYNSIKRVMTRKL